MDDKKCTQSAGKSIKKPMKKPFKTPFHPQIPTNPANSFKHIIAVMSGKGGVGKSTVAANLAMALQAKGYKTGILDADVIGPSIPRVLGCEKGKLMMYAHGLAPYQMSNGLKVVSLNLMLEDEEKPVIWRGPIVTNTVKQFYTDIIWENLDYLVLDMPPGTSDVSLTVLQSLPVDGVVMVTIPQDMVSMIVSKAINMTKKLNVPLLGLVNNMSYMICPHCDEKIELFKTNQSSLDKYQVAMLAELPMKPDYATVTGNDAGFDQIFGRMADQIVEQLDNLVDKGNPAMDDSGLSHDDHQKG